VSVDDVAADPASVADCPPPPSAAGDPDAPVSAPPAATARAPDPAGAAAGGELAGELAAGAALAALPYVPVAEVGLAPRSPVAEPGARLGATLTTTMNVIAPATTAT
jgi:hypothetical protein